jgi:transcriptional regulator with XRE-family HTH domain
MKSLDPMRDDAGVRLRTLRLRRGLTRVALADLACISAAFISMIENGQRTLTRASDILALVDVLKVSPLYLADGREDSPAAARPVPGALPFPARCDSMTLGRHKQLAHQFIQFARHDARAAGEWLRHLARVPDVNPWLLIDQLTTTLHTQAHSAGPPAHRSWPSGSSRSSAATACSASAGAGRLGGTAGIAGSSPVDS